MSIEYTETHARIVRNFAFKAWRRAIAAGASTLQLEDVIGELMIAWCAARDRYDADRGVPFEAFLTNGMRVAINRFLRLQIEFGHHASLDIGDSDNASPHDQLADERGLEGIEAFERNDARDDVMVRLSPRARLFVDLLREPPTFLLDAVRGRRERQAHAKQMGLPTPLESDHVTASLVFDFMGSDRDEKNRIYKELRRVGRDE